MPSDRVAHTLATSEHLPKSAGPYSPGVGFERLVFVSGQDAADPATGKVVSATVEVQTEQVLKNVQAILEASGSSLCYVLRCGVYLTDIGEFKKMNDVYERMFDNHRPARTTVQVAALPSPEMKVEIDAVAYLP